MEYYRLSEKEALDSLRTNEKGLSQEEADKRLKEYGENKLKEIKRISVFELLLEQFTSPLVLILIGAAVASFIIKEFIDSYLIFAIVILNGFLGFVQEYKAEKAVELLKKLTSLKSMVVRDSKIKEVYSTELVPGDIVLVEMGDKVPADLRIIESSDLYVNEASLTGESQPVHKSLAKIEKSVAIADQKNMLFLGTIITRGKGKAVVAGTGMNTELGKIAGIVQETETELTPLQVKLKQLGKFLSVFILLIIVVITFTGIYKGGTFFDMLLIGISLAVAAIPEGLPAVVTIALSIGTKKMIKRNVLVKRLTAVEALGSVDVICSDKTGTLTKGEMTVKKIFCDNKLIDIEGSGYSTSGRFLSSNKEFSSKELELILKIGLLNNDAVLQDHEFIGDPTEIALLISALKFNLKKEDLEKEYPRIDTVAFTSERKMMSTLHKHKNGNVVFSKGAVEILLKKCSRIYFGGMVRRLTAPPEANNGFANNGLRVLGFAYKKSEKDRVSESDENNLIFLGMQAMIDPPREEAIDAVKKCKEAGIRVIMITGDNAITAEAVAKELGIHDKVITGEELEKINLDEVVEDISIYARVNPEHKIKIVDALKKKGHIVAMTGDGVNDAPALKKADIGVAMGKTGTDVSKDAASMILVDDNFASIVNAIEEGRGIYDNIKKFVNYLLSANLGEVLVLFIPIMLGWQYLGKIAVPLVAVQLLWLNLVTDGMPALALGFDKPEEMIMRRQPRKTNEKIISANMFWNIIATSLLITAAVLYIFNYGLSVNLVKAQTLALTTIVMLEFARVYIIEKEYKARLFSNKYLLFAIAFSIFLQLLVVYTPLNFLLKLMPLNLMDWAYIIGLVIVVFVISYLSNKLITILTKETD
ncbi:cation-translocating P-type ATPase [Candidatus Woesearchaeota archaeon]|nr:cation-translocating P-type ATPase [Candidatus Woesearchaeota archaeon]